MSVEPLFTIDAHVFYIEPDGKKEWTPGCRGSVPVNVYYNAPRNNYRIVAIVDDKAIVNSALQPDYSFIKTSHKFGQWLDVNSGILYGLGFDNENDLNAFSKRFDQYKTAPNTKQSNGVGSKQQQQQNHPHKYIPGDMDEDEEIMAPERDSNRLYSKPPNRGSRTRGGDFDDFDDENFDNTNYKEEVDQLKNTVDKLEDRIGQLNKENRKKDDEINTLKKNNSKLTNALKESATNVDEWKKLLHKYREESLEAKNKISEMEADQREKELAFQEKNRDDERVQALENALRDKERELEIMNRELLASQNENNRLQMDNDRLQNQLYNMNNQIDQQQQETLKKKRETQELIQQMNGKINELQIMTGSVQTRMM